MKMCAKLLQAIEQRRTPLRVFLRNDDVADDELRLRRLLALCAQHQVPISLAVIPGLLTERGINLLGGGTGSVSDLSLEIRRSQNVQVAHAPLTATAFVELHQHGWLHANHEPSGKKCEFGATRDYQNQLADLAAGQARMNEAFGACWFPAFTPPWNRCTDITAQALADLGFRVLSRESSQASFDHPNLPEFSVTLDLFRWRGGAALRATDELNDELTQQVLHADRIGIMLHHQVMDDAAFALLDEWLTVLKQAPRISFHTLQSLLDTE